MNIIIPIGGIGRRFLDEGYNLPKPLIKSLGTPILILNIENLKFKDEDTLFIVYREELKLYNFENTLINNFRNINFKFIPIKGDTRGAAETVLYALQEMNSEELNETTVVIDSDNVYHDDVLSLCRKKQQNLIIYHDDFEENPIYSYITFDKKNKINNIKEKIKISKHACSGVYCFENSNTLKNSIECIVRSNERQNKEYYISCIYDYLIRNKQKVFAKKIKNFICLGTPSQLKIASTNFNSNKKYRFCFDLDNTLVSYPKIKGDYSSVEPIEKTINFLNFLHLQGHTIIIYTARRMKTHDGNVGRVQADICKTTIETLERFGIKYDEIYFGKPYAHFYIDDLSLRPFENLEKETGFYDIHPKTRDYNCIQIFDKTIKKYSQNINGEKYFYQNIPKDISYLFPKILDCGENFIEIEKINGIPLSFLNSSNTLTEKIILQVLRSIDIIHKTKVEIDKSVNIYANYYKKTLDRINNYNFSEYKGYERKKELILNFLQNYESSNNGKISVIHGDPVFTNILLDQNDKIKFIDMRGKMGEQLTIFGDIFYDYAKIYQSLIGYDHILMGREPNLNKNNIEIFEEYIKKEYDYSALDNIKNITKSLIFSLIPIHNNKKCLLYYSLI